MTNKQPTKEYKIGYDPASSDGDYVRIFVLEDGVTTIFVPESELQQERERIVKEVEELKFKEYSPAFDEQEDFKQRIINIINKTDE